MTSLATRTRLIWRGGKKVRAHRWLMEQERLVQIRDARDLDRIQIRKAEHRRPVLARAGLAEELCDLILERRTASLEQRCL